MDKDKLKVILDLHKKWVYSEGGGERAYLSGADLSGAYLRGADLSGADLSGADLRGADLRGAKGIEESVPYNQNCPEEGDFVGWKKVYCNGPDTILKIKITGKRVSPITGRKCRTDECVVLEAFNLEGEEKSELNTFYAGHDHSFIYTVGETVREPEYNDSFIEECTQGIHFFITKQEAIDW